MPRRQLRSWETLGVFREATHIVYSVNERIVTTVAHREPVTAEEYYVDVSVPVDKKWIDE